MKKKILATGLITIYNVTDMMPSTSPPPNPQVGTLWIDNSVNPPTLKMWDGRTWVVVNDYSDQIGDLDGKVEQVKQHIQTWTEKYTHVEHKITELENGMRDTVKRKDFEDKAQSIETIKGELAQEVSVREQHDLKINNIEKTVTDLDTKFSRQMSNEEIKGLIESNYSGYTNYLRNPTFVANGLFWVADSNTDIRIDEQNKTLTLTHGGKITAELSPQMANRLDTKYILSGIFKTNADNIQVEITQQQKNTTDKKAVTELIYRGYINDFVNEEGMINPLKIRLIKSTAIKLKISFSIPNENGKTLKVQYPKLETGWKASSWSCDYEDKIDLEINKTNSKIEQTSKSFIQQIDSTKQLIGRCETEIREVDRKIVQGDLYACGGGYGCNNKTEVLLNNTNMGMTTNRGINLITIKRKDLTLIDRRGYDVYGSDQDRKECTKYLNALQDDVIIIISSFDAVNCDGELINAIHRCGANITAQQFYYRISYVLVGIPGIGKGAGIEMWHNPVKVVNDTLNAPLAEISTKIINGVPQGINKTLVSTIKDFDVKVEEVVRKISEDNHTAIQQLEDRINIGAWGRKIEEVSELTTNITSAIRENEKGSGDNLLKDTLGPFKGESSQYTVKTYDVPKEALGKKFTISCECRVTKKGKNTNIYMAVYDDPWKYAESIHSEENITEWTRLSMPIKHAPATGPLHLGFWNFADKNGGEVEIRKVQLNLGSVAPPYNMNVEEEIAINESKINKAENKINKRIDDEQLGGRNLVKNSEFAKGIENWTIENNVAADIVDLDGNNGFKKALHIKANGVNQLVTQSVGGLVVGRDYILSCWCMNKSGQCVLMQHDWNTNINTTQFEWIRLIVKFKATSTTEKIYLGRSAGGENGEYFYTGVQLQEGTKISPWQESVFDMGDRVELLNRKAQENDEKVSVANQLVSEAVKKAQDAINASSSVKATVDVVKKTTEDCHAGIETLKEKITHLVSSDEVTNIKTSLDGKILNIDTLVKNCNSKIEQTKNGITSKVEENLKLIQNTSNQLTDANNSIQNLGKQNSSLQQSINSFKYEVSLSGNSNILYNSGAKSKDCCSWYYEGNEANGALISKGDETTINNFITGKCFELSNTSRNTVSARSCTIRLKPNTKYTMSFKYNTDNCYGVDVKVFYSNKARNKTSETDYVSTANLGAFGESPAIISKVMHFSTGQTVNSAYFKIENKGNKSGFISKSILNFGEIMLVEGDIDKPWSPNSDETYTAITEINDNGITVDHTQSDTMTRMSQDGFSIVDKKNHTVIASFGVTDGGQMSSLKVDDVECPVVARYVADGHNAELYVCVNGRGDKSGRNSGNAAGSVNSALDYYAKGGKILRNGQTITINMEGGTYGGDDINIYGYSGQGAIKIKMNNNVIISSRIDIQYCTCIVVINGGPSAYSGAILKTWIKTHETPAIIVKHSTSVYIDNIRHVGWRDESRGKKDAGTYFARIECSNVMMETCDISETYAIAYAMSCSQVGIRNCRGSHNWYLARGENSSVISVSVNRPRFEYNDELGCGSNWGEFYKLNVAGALDSVFYPDSHTSSSKVTRGITNTFAGGNYRSWRNAEKWRSGFMYQSSWGSSYGRWYGYCDFGCSQWASRCQNKNSMTGRIRLSRKAHQHGQWGGAGVHVCDNNGNSFGKLGDLSLGETSWFTLPNGAIQYIISNGFICFYSSSDNDYIQFDNNAVLELSGQFSV